MQSKQAVAASFKAVDRADFMPDDVKNHADADRPLPIGYGQTISQPSTVQMMLEWLDVQPGDKVLDIGSGSGWTTALLAHLTGPDGDVFAVEKIPELVEFGRENCKKSGIENVEFFEAGESFGLPEKAPFDKILVSASAEELPEELLDQLNPGGKLVVPVKNDILEIAKSESGGIETEAHAGFVFVPLVR